MADPTFNPLIVQSGDVPEHNDTRGLNTGDYRHLTATQLQGVVALLATSTPPVTFGTTTLAIPADNSRPEFSDSLTLTRNDATGAVTLTTTVQGDASNPPSKIEFMLGNTVISPAEQSVPQLGVPTQFVHTAGVNKDSTSKVYKIRVTDSFARQVVYTFSEIRFIYPVTIQVVAPDGLAALIGSLTGSNDPMQVLTQVIPRTDSTLTVSVTEGGPNQQIAFICPTAFEVTLRDPQGLDITESLTATSVTVTRIYKNFGQPGQSSPIEVPYTIYSTPTIYTGFSGDWSMTLNANPYGAL